MPRPRLLRFRFLYLLAFMPGPHVGTLSIPNFAPDGLRCSATMVAVAVCAPVFAFKQVTNVLQMFIAFDAINQCELERRGKVRKQI